MKAVGVTMGALVSAVVLLVVAVPILGGLAGSSITVMPDESNDGLTYYYRSLNNEDGYTLVNLEINRGSSTNFTTVTSNWTYDNMVFTETYEIPRLTKNYFFVIGEKGGIYSGNYSSNPRIYTDIRNFQPINANVDTSATVTIVKTNDEWNMTVSSTVTTDTVTQRANLGPDALVICPMDIADFIGGKTMITKDRAIILNATIERQGSNVGSSIWADYTVDNGIVPKTIIPWSIGQTVTNTDINLEIDQNENGIITLSNLETSQTIMINGVAHTASGSEYTILVPVGAVTVSTESEYSYLIWLLPVMLAVVLIASVAYQIVPKRRNNE